MLSELIRVYSEKILEKSSVHKQLGEDVDVKLNTNENMNDKLSRNRERVMRRNGKRNYLDRIITDYGEFSACTTDVLHEMTRKGQ